VTATSFHLIGKETERGWEQNDDISTLMPSLVRYGSDTGVADEQLRKRLLGIPLAFLEFENWIELATRSCEHEEVNQYTPDHCDFSRTSFVGCQFESDLIQFTVPKLIGDR